jgi:hypothetical protein
MTGPGPSAASPVNCHAPTRGAGAAAGAPAALTAVTATAGLLTLASAAPGHRRSGRGGAAAPGRRRRW